MMQKYILLAALLFSTAPLSAAAAVVDPRPDLGENNVGEVFDKVKALKQLLRSKAGAGRGIQINAKIKQLEDQIRAGVNWSDFDTVAEQIGDAATIRTIEAIRAPSARNWAQPAQAPRTVAEVKALPQNTPAEQYYKLQQFDIFKTNGKLSAADIAAMDDLKNSAVTQGVLQGQATTIVENLKQSKTEEISQAGAIKIQSAQRRKTATQQVAELRAQRAAEAAAAEAAAAEAAATRIQAFARRNAARNAFLEQKNAIATIQNFIKKAALPKIHAKNKAIVIALQAFLTKYYQTTIEAAMGDIYNRLGTLAREDNINFDQDIQPLIGLILPKIDEKDTSLFDDYIDAIKGIMPKPARPDSSGGTAGAPAGGMPGSGVVGGARAGAGGGAAQPSAEDRRKAAAAADDRRAAAGAPAGGPAGAASGSSAPAGGQSGSGVVGGPAPAVIPAPAQARPPAAPPVRVIIEDIEDDDELDDSDDELSDDEDNPLYQQDEPTTAPRGGQSGSAPAQQPPAPAAKSPAPSAPSAPQRAHLVPTPPPALPAGGGSAAALSGTRVTPAPAPVPAPARAAAGSTPSRFQDTSLQDSEQVLSAALGRPSNAGVIGSGRAAAILGSQAPAGAGADAGSGGAGAGGGAGALARPVSPPASPAATATGAGAGASAGARAGTGAGAGSTAGVTTPNLTRVELEYYSNNAANMPDDLLAWNATENLHKKFYQYLNDTLKQSINGVVESINNKETYTLDLRTIIGNQVLCLGFLYSLASALPQDILPEFKKELDKNFNNNFTTSNRTIENLKRNLDLFISDKIKGIRSPTFGLSGFDRGSSTYRWSAKTLLERIAAGEQTAGGVGAGAGSGGASAGGAGAPARRVSPPASPAATATGGAGTGAGGASPGGARAPTSPAATGGAGAGAGVGAPAGGMPGAGVVAPAILVPIGAVLDRIITLDRTDGEQARSKLHNQKTLTKALTYLFYAHKNVKREALYMNACFDAVVEVYTALTDLINTSAARTNNASILALQQELATKDIEPKSKYNDFCDLFKRTSDSLQPQISAALLFQQPNLLTNIFTAITAVITNVKAINNGNNKKSLQNFMRSADALFAFLNTETNFALSAPAASTGAGAAAAGAGSGAGAASGSTAAPAAREVPESAVAPVVTPAPRVPTPPPGSPTAAPAEPVSEVPRSTASSQTTSPLSTSVGGAGAGGPGSATSTGGGVGAAAGAGTGAGGAEVEEIEDTHLAVVALRPNWTRGSNADKISYLQEQIEQLFNAFRAVATSNRPADTVDPSAEKAYQDFCTAVGIQNNQDFVTIRSPLIGTSQEAKISGGLRDSNYFGFLVNQYFILATHALTAATNPKTKKFLFFEKSPAAPKTGTQDVITFVSIAEQHAAQAFLMQIEQLRLLADNTDIMPGSAVSNRKYQDGLTTGSGAREALLTQSDQKKLCDALQGIINRNDRAEDAQLQTMSLALEFWDDHMKRSATPWLGRKTPAAPFMEQIEKIVTYSERRTWPAVETAKNMLRDLEAMQAQLVVHCPPSKRISSI